MKSRTESSFRNVCTLSDDSRLAQIEAEVLRYDLHMLGLNEGRRNGFGELRMSKRLTFLYSGKNNEEDDRKNGVGFLFSDFRRRIFLD